MKAKKIMAILMSAAVMFTFTCVPAFADTSLEKEESVYVITDTEGEVEKITVSEWLKTDKEGELKDVSNLKDIENVKGDEKFKKDGKEIIWEAEGEDIYYQGTIDKELPVKMDIAYYMNGIRRSPEKMAGKNGKFRIEISFEAAEEVPFAAVSALSLSGNEFKNVTVNSGEVVSTGESLYIAGVALPGMEDLTSKFETGLSSKIEIKGKCKNFESSDIYTVLTNDLIEDIDTGDTIDKLESSLNTLVDASAQLAEGSSKLAEGLGELKTNYVKADDGIGDLADGAQQLNNGVVEMQANMPKLTEGSQKLAEGAETFAGYLDQTSEMVHQFAGMADVLGDINLDELEEGLTALYTNLGAINSGLGELQGTMADINGQEAQVIEALMQVRDGYRSADIDTTALDGVIEKLQTTNGYQAQAIAGLDADGKIRGGITQMQQGISSMDIELPEGIDQIPGKIQQLDDALASEAKGAHDLANGTAELNQGITALSDGTDALAEGTGKLSSGADELKKGSKKLNDGIGQLSDGADTLADGMSQFDKDGTGKLKSLYDEYGKNTIDKIDGLVNKAKDYESFGGNSKNENVKLKFIIKSRGVSSEEEKQ